MLVPLFAAAQDVIVDNRDPGCALTGDSWHVSEWGVNYGTDKFYSDAGIGDGAATWTAALTPGTYEVRAWITQGGYSTNAHYTISHAGGVTDVYANQNYCGGSWCIELGSYLFAGTGSVSVSDDAGSGMVVADAVIWQHVSGPTATSTPIPTATPTVTLTPSPTLTATRTPTLPPGGEVIVDDGDAGYTETGGTWHSSPYGQCYQGDKRYTDSGTGLGYASWTGNLPAGRYRVDAWVNTATYTTEARYTVHHAGGQTDLIRSQSGTSGGWCVDLGEYDFGATGTVEVSDDASSGMVVADAIRWTLVTAYTPTVTPSGQPTLTPTPTPQTGGGPEFRGIWVTRWNYDSVADIQQIMTNAANAHFNAVLFQVRGRADAFYQSDYEPWAAELTGTLGQDPGWDPLATAVTEAHARGLELHAWVNVFPCWSGLVPPPHCQPEHIYNAHPEWLQADSSGVPMPLNDGYVAISPGNLEVHDHLMNVFADIVSKYDIDGLHYDYIRYAGSAYSHDAVSEYRFIHDNPQGLGWADWQRSQINILVARAYQQLLAQNPDLKITAAVWGIYRNYWGWPASQGYFDYYQDSQYWAQMGIIDALCPMIYWPMYVPGGNPPYFDYLVPDFVSHAGDRHIYAGMHGNYSNFQEIIDEIQFSRQAGTFGNVVFAYSYIVQRGYWDDYRNGPYATPVSVPVMPWKQTATPRPTETPAPPTATATRTPTGTPPTMTPTPTATRTPTATNTQPQTPTLTPTPTRTSTLSPTPSVTYAGTATPTATPSPPGPTATPTRTSTPVASGTPEPSATPLPLSLGATLVMPSNFYFPGDTFSVTVIVGNPGNDLESIPLFVVLDVYGDYYFWPGWKRFHPPESEEIDYLIINLTHGQQAFIVLYPFAWPAVSPGVSGIAFHAALLNRELTAILGEMDSFYWGYGG